MTPGQRYLQALAARTPPPLGRAARSFAEIEGATTCRPDGKISRQETSYTDIYGKTVKRMSGS